MSAYKSDISDSRPLNTWRGPSCLVIIAVVISPLMLKFANAPYVWILGLWTVSCGGMMVWIQTTNLRALLVNCVAAFGFLAAAETYFWYDELVSRARSSGVGAGYRAEGAVVDGYTNRDYLILGYAPHKGIAVDARKYYGDQIVYDVVYTIDDNGLRVAPPVAEQIVKTSPRAQATAP